MASPPLVLPGVLFVGEDDRARVTAHLGPAAGWFVPHGIGDWSTEVSLVTRESLTEEIRKSTKLVMPEEQIPPAKMPLAREAALKAPIVAVSSKLVPKLVESGLRVHTVGVDRVTSSFYYLAEGGGEEAVKVSGDLVQAVGAMLGERADNAAIERVLDGLTDRLVRALSRDRLSELSVELASLLPRAAADGSGTQDIDLEAFEKQLSELVAASEKYRTQAKLIADDIAGTYERKIAVPLFGEARKVSLGPFDLMVGEKKVTLPTSEKWVMSGPLVEAVVKAPSSPPVQAKPVTAAPRPASVPPPRPEPAKVEPKRDTKPIPREEPPDEPKKVEARPEPKPEPAKVEPKPEPKPEPKAEEPKKKESERSERTDEKEPEKAVAKAEEPKKEPAKTEATAEAKAETKAEPKKTEKTPEKSEKTPEKSASSVADTQKMRRRDEPEKSSTMILVAFILLAAAGYLAYRVWFSH